MAIEQKTLERVLPEEKKSWWSVAFVWAGNVICVPALMVGGMCVAGLDFPHAVLSMVLGYVIVVAYMFLLSAQSAQLGVPSTVSFGRALGSRGSGAVISLVIAVSYIGWFGFQTFICASSFCGLMLGLGIKIPIWIGCIFWGIVMLITAVVGFSLIKILNMVSVPALFIFLIYGLVSVLSNGSGNALSTYQPEMPMPMITGITLAVSGFAVGAITSGDYNRYCKGTKDAALACCIGVLPAGIGALVIGGVLSICTGTYDITSTFASMGVPIIGMIVLILATWTTNTGNAYSAGIAVVNLLKLKDNRRNLATLFCGGIGIVLSLGGFVNNFVTFLSFLGFFIPPIAGVVIADYWILGKGKTESWKQVNGVNWIGICCWLVGAATAYFSKFFVPTLNGIIVSMVLYIICMKLIKSEKLNPFI